LFQTRRSDGRLSAGALSTFHFDLIELRAQSSVDVIRSEIAASSITQVAAFGRRRSHQIPLRPVCIMDATLATRFSL
jgi:hypothetical protein